MTEQLPEWVWDRRDEKDVRDLIIMSTWPMLTRVVGRLRQHLPAHVRVEEGDLRSYGLIGLYKALDRFDPENGTPFDKFASSYVWGAVHDELRALDWAPRTLRKRQRDLEFSKLRFVKEHQREPLDSELAELLECDVDDVAATRRQVDSAWLRSLDEIRHQSSQDMYAIIAGVEGDPEAHLIQTTEGPEDDRSTLLTDKMATFVENMEPQKRAVTCLIYFLGLKQSEVSSVLGVPESRVSSIHLNVMEDFHDELEKLLTESA